MLNNCSTQLGRLRFDQWIKNPTQNKMVIEKRLDSIEILIKNVELLNTILNLIKNCGNIQVTFYNLIHLYHCIIIIVLFIL